MRIPVIFVIVRMSIHVSFALCYKIYGHPCHTLLTAFFTILFCFSFFKFFFFLSCSSANKCLLKVAMHSAQMEEYAKALEIYEQVSCVSFTFCCTLVKCSLFILVLKFDLWFPIKEWEDLEKMPTKGAKCQVANIAGFCDKHNHDLSHSLWPDAANPNVQLHKPIYPLFSGYALDRHNKLYLLVQNAWSVIN